mmetsp:Transcript_45142/g.130692  ORF Transcript_45142/g.130692 Transcript_45142/m.130692 type:complete len:215 (-) Transcript_45142:1771-2415(-)
MRFSPRSSRENVGTVWKRRQPAESSSASPLFSSLGCHLCRLTLTCTSPMRLSPGSRPPSMIGLSLFISATHAAGTSSSRTRTKAAMGMPSEKPTRSAVLTLVTEPLLAPAVASPVPSAAGLSPSAGLGSPSSSSSALLQPPVMNFRSLRASLASSSSASVSPGKHGIRAVSMPSRSPMFPRRPESAPPCCGFCPGASAASSSPSNSGIALWSVG